MLRLAEISYNKIKGSLLLLIIFLVFVVVFILSSGKAQAQCTGTYWCQAYDEVYGVCSDDQVTQRLCQGSTAQECYASAYNCEGGCSTLSTQCLWNGVGGGISSICMPDWVTEDPGCFPTSPACCEVPDRNPCITVNDHTCAVRAVDESGYGWCLCIPDGPWLTPPPTPTPGSIENECLGTVDGNRIGCVAACPRDGFALAGKQEYCEENEPGTLCCLLEVPCSNLGVRYACLSQYYCASPLMNTVGRCDGFLTVCCDAFGYEAGQNCDYDDLYSCTLDGGYYNCQWSDNCAGSEGVWSCCRNPEQEFDNFGEDSDIPIGCSFSFDATSLDGNPNPNGNCISLATIIDPFTMQAEGVGDGRGGAGDEWRVVDLEGNVLESGSGDAARFTFLANFNVTYVLQFQLADGSWASSSASSVFRPIMCGLNRLLTGIGCLDTEPGAFVEDVFAIFILTGGGVAFLMMVVGSFFILISQGDSEMLRRGKEVFVGGVVGLLVFIFSTFLLELIGVDILGLFQS